SKGKRVRYGPRYGTLGNQDVVELPDGTRRILFTGGVIVSVASLDGSETTEFATDDAVIWYRGAGGKGPLNDLVTTGDEKERIEVYLSGNVIIRTVRGQGAGRVAQTVRAQEVYYDATLNRAIAVRADLETNVPSVKDPIHIRGEEVRRLDLENWEALNATLDASKLPSDPGLRLDSRRFTMSERRVVRRNLFGVPIRDIRTGEAVEFREQIVTGENVVTRLGGVPAFYIPALRANASDPLGPLQGFSFSQNRMFGPSVYTTWDMYELLALRPPPTHKWRLDLDYLSRRGPAAGSTYTYTVPTSGTDPLPVGSGLVKLYGLSDHRGMDILGGTRGPEPTPQDLRGRALWRHQQEVTEGLYFQGQLGLLSDKNFLEQFYKNEFDMGPNQETFAYLAWQRRNFGATALIEDRVTRQWVSETNWLPRVDGHVLGQTFLDDWLVYGARGSAGFAQARPSEYNPYPVLTTDRRVDTGRFDVSQEVSAPLALGPVKFAPYGILDLTEYTSDLNGNTVGRVYGAGGARASVPFSHLYGDVASELLNLRGLYHKVVVGANYRVAGSNVPYNQLPLLDRLNDDATDQAFRNIVPYQSFNVPGPAGAALANAGGYSPFNPQLYAIRRLVENRVDTLDDVQVLQMDVRQRFQTKRGYPGLEHTVDFLTFDVSASYFPAPNRDNFGHPFSFLEYGGVWNVGDRTALVSNGWFEPYENGSRYWNAGVHFNRTDRTNVYLGYRQTDPLNSKAVVLNLGYQLSRRYYANVGASYDFGLGQALSNSLTLTRTGADLTVTVGFTYTAFVNSFGFQFLVVPNLAAGRFGTPFSGQSANRR
ncbi:MAG: hypothetical protein J0I06_21935, partial [Planctomycetes bacterium]|nr:hypothetical protein [Planctomycetota bacterium]